MPIDVYDVIREHEDFADCLSNGDDEKREKILGYLNIITDYLEQRIDEVS